MSTSIEDIKKDINQSRNIYFALLVLTVVTVAVSGLKIGLAFGIILALCIAALKATLVAGFFMHLLHEKKLILVLLGFTVFFFIAMILLIYFGQYCLPEGAQYVP